MQLKILFRTGSGVMRRPVAAAGLLTIIGLFAACSSPSTATPGAPSSSTATTPASVAPTAPVAPTSSTRPAPPTTVEPRRISEGDLLTFISEHHPEELPLLQEARAGGPGVGEPYLTVRPVGDAQCAAVPGCIDPRPPGVKIGLPMKDLTQADAIALCNAIADYTKPIDSKLQVYVEYHLHIAELWNGTCR